MANNIKSQLFSGVFYTALAKYSGVVISLVVAGILARLLSPDDFGIVAVATVIIAFFNLLTDMGVSPAIVQHKSLTKDDLSDIFSFTIWTGIGISILFFASSWIIADYYQSDTLRILCQLLSVNLFFASATIVPGAMFYRNKEFKFIAIRSFVIQISAGAAAVTAALCGAGLYALIINPIVSSVLIFVISFQRYPQRLRFTLGLRVLRKIFSYSAYQFLFNVINYFSRNLDKLLIGKYMSMSDLGYYEKSYRLMMLPLQNITQVITPVMHPIFSDFQNDKGKLLSSYERIVRFLAFIGLPLSVLLFFTAEEVTLIIFGDQWMPSVPVFRILSLSVGIQIILSSSGSIFQAAGDTRSLFVCGVFSSAFNVAGILLGIFHFGTLTAVASCIVVTFTINFIQCYWQMYRVTFRQSAWPFIRQLISPLVISILIALVLIPMQYALEGMNIFVTIIAKGIVSFIIFGIYIQMTHEYDMISKVRSLRKKKSIAMNIRDIFITLRYKISYGSTVEWYNFWYIVLRKKRKIIPQVASIDETIRKIIDDRCSVSRFGDGEVLLTSPDKEIRFQKGDPLLAKRLTEVLQSHEEGHIVCISDAFRDLYRYNRKSRRFWRTHFYLYGSWWDRLLVAGRKYYNTFVTRPYMDFARKEDSARWFHDMKGIWDNRDIVFIEGEKSRLGVGNDLFDNARSIRRILCPPRDAFERLEDIKQEACKVEKEALFLIALGPAATVLAYDLFKAGYQAIDVGHVDVEYEWWRMGAHKKVKLERKYVNETAIGSEVADAGEEYRKQIIAQIV